MPQAPSPDDILEDVLNMAGGFNAVADTSRVAVQRIDFTKEDQVVELHLPERPDVPRVWALASYMTIEYNGRRAALAPPYSNACPTWRNWPSTTSRTWIT